MRNSMKCWRRCGMSDGTAGEAIVMAHGLGADAADPAPSPAAPRPQAVEWQSQLLPRYQRRAGAVDAALLGTYLSGTNGRRIKGALAPLLRGAPLSKSAVSRLLGRVKAL